MFPSPASNPLQNLTVQFGQKDERHCGGVIDRREICLGTKQARSTVQLLHTRSTALLPIPSLTHSHRCTTRNKLHLVPLRRRREHARSTTTFPDLLGGGRRKMFAILCRTKSA